ncbi:MAG: hypothetical protein ACYDA1_06060 [Vulcanimicrobiaceae bacterium]
MTVHARSRFARFASFAGSLALVALVACAKKSSTPPVTPTPGPLTPSVATIALSLSGAGTVPTSIASITITQANATGSLTYSTTSCYGATPSPTSILVMPSSTTSLFSNGTATLTFGAITSQATGSCSFIVTPASGTALTIPVTVSP